jgi:cytoskeletal protein CcmA (bactofilin family)
MPLFGKKTKENKSKQIRTNLSQNETSYFGKNLTIKGRVSGNGNIIILGSLNGEFDLRGRVKIAQPAKIMGEVKATVISVNGSVQGSLDAQERLHLDQTARIKGQLTTPKLSVSEGASIDGEIKMSGRSVTPSKPAATDPVQAPQNPQQPKEK